jgi:hypothetical protein
MTGLSAAVTMRRRRSISKWRFVNMLRVRLEIVPFGDESKAREIGRLDIFNKQCDFNHINNEVMCQYGVIELDKEKNTGAMYSEDIPHYRQDGAWKLVRKVLDERWT